MGTKPQPRVRVRAPEPLKIAGGGTIALGSELGRGSRAVVREGLLDMPSGLRRPVTVKLYGHVASDERRAVHDTLITIASHLHTAEHPSLHVPFDVGISAGIPYAVFARIRSAQSLAKILRGRKRFALDAALLIGVAACEGVAAAHEAGVIHGDLSPRQILISAEGDVRVSDFAEYRTSQGTSGVQRATSLRERLAHIAPEIVRGAPPSVATDVFSLGIVLNELFQGPRFRDDMKSDALLAAVRKGEVIRPIFAPILDERLANVLHRALAARAADRFRSVNELVRELRAVLHGANLPDARTFIRDALGSGDLGRTIESEPCIDVDSAE